jgi:hypothetical protein
MTENELKVYKEYRLRILANNNLAIRGAFVLRNDLTEEEKQVIKRQYELYSCNPDDICLNTVYNFYLQELYTQLHTIDWMSPTVKTTSLMCPNRYDQHAPQLTTRQIRAAYLGLLVYGESHVYQEQDLLEKIALQPEIPVDVITSIVNRLTARWGNRKQHDDTVLTLLCVHKDTPEELREQILGLQGFERTDIYRLIKPFDPNDTKGVKLEILINLRPEIVKKIVLGLPQLEELSDDQSTKQEAPAELAAA